MGSIIEVKNIYKTYGDLHVVHNIIMKVQRGDIYGLIGLNGAGKTTLIKLLLGIIKPTKGCCAIFGEKVSHLSSYLWNNVGYVIENAQAYPDLTVYENLLIQRKLYRITDDGRFIVFYPFFN